MGSKTRNKMDAFFFMSFEERMYVPCVFFSCFWLLAPPEVQPPVSRGPSSRPYGMRRLSLCSVLPLFSAAAPSTEHWSSEELELGTGTGHQGD
jgi:hypothetical protein